jgi:hypothetical protein
MPRQIYNFLSRADRFHKDDVAREFENGVVDWILTFTSAQKLREDPTRIVVTFNIQRRPKAASSGRDNRHES